ncbi:MAG: NlpC/P60 family protein [Actinomycetota bacterium]|nr:NlpC/P60 family protein [Actinomycetota bacterium]
MTGRARRSAFLVLVALLAALFSGPPVGADPGVSAKRAEAERVLAEVEQIDARLEQVVDAYDAAQERLGQIGEEQAANRRHLRLARASFARSERLLQQRLLALYTSADSSVVEILLGASSLDELLARVETVDRVSDQDARIVRQVRAWRGEVQRREAELAQARDEQERVVAERAERRREIEAQLAERRRVLSSIKDEIAKMEAAERERQERLQAQARARVAETAASPAPESSAPSPPLSGSLGAPPPSSRYGGVVAIAMRYLGVPYRWGGSSPSTGFDCSGFVMYVYAQVGVSLPHNAAAQYGLGVPVSRSDLEPGDLVFFNGLGHMGIYVGGGQFIHAPHTGDVVKISSLSESWYASTWVGARRIT